MSVWLRAVLYFLLLGVAFVAVVYALTWLDESFVSPWPERQRQHLQMSPFNM